MAQPFLGLQLDYLSATNIFAAPNFLEQFLAGRAVEIQDGERGAAGLISAE